MPLASRLTRNGRRAAAAVEFALVVPVLVLVLSSLPDLTNAILTWWQVAQAADAIGRIATRLAVTDGPSNLLTQDQARRASTAALPLLPGWPAANSSHEGVVLTAIVFAPTVPGCTQACTYVANVAWSATLQGGLPPRPCGRMLPAPDIAVASMTTLPASAFGATSLLVVDVAAQFKPLISTLLGPALDVAVAGLMAARNGGPGDWIRISGPTAAGLRCPGYT